MKLTDKQKEIKTLFITFLKDNYIYSSYIIALRKLGYKKHPHKFIRNCIGTKKFGPYLLFILMSKDTFSAWYPYHLKWKELLLNKKIFR